ncbi:PAS domain-containing protein [Edaphobacter modestus]|uniref:PAS domain-containing protein n=1 Tax=Edaphobacter modestus TaxID=388466 RepID=UPI0013EEA631|nr:PAS domain-containing protein [Edaphobacter modestus]
MNLRQVIDSAPALIHTARPDGYLDFFNRTWLDFVGQPLKSLLGWKWTSWIHPEDVESFVQKWRESLATGERFEGAARVRRADGEYRWMLHHKLALRARDGEILKWHGSSIDIENRKRTEEQLRRTAQELQKSEFYLAEAQRLGHIGNWVFDPAVGFDYWSRELFRIHGLDPAAGVPGFGKYLTLVHPQDREFMALLMEQMTHEFSGFDVTKRVVRPAGEVRYIRCVGTPILDNGTMKSIGVGIDVTEHELLTQELRRREAYLAEAQRLSHTGSFGWRPGYEEHIWSDETYCIFEYDPATKVTLDMIVERVHPEDRNFVLETVERASTSGGAIDYEYRLLFPDDRVKYVHVLARPLGTDSDDLEFAGAVIDITEAKRAEEKIRLNERELRTIIEIMPAYMGTALPDGTVDFLSPSWFDYSGQTREEATGWGWAGVLHPDDADRVLANWQAGLASGKPVEQEFRCRRADGTYHWFLNRSLPLRDDEGRIVKWYGILFDVNSLKEAEHALQTREHQLVGIIETIPSMLWSLWPTGEPAHLSKRFLEYFGAPFEEFANRGWMSLIHSDDREETLKVFVRALETGELFSVINRLRRADGEYRWHHTMGEPLRDPDGKIIQWYGLTVDIDERKRAEDHLRDTRIKFSRASKIATVAELSASIAHELNQPLTAVLGNAQAAKRWLTANPPDLTETNASIDRILRDIRSADETMQRIRALFRSEPYEKSDESVLDIIRESLRFIQEDPSKREVQIDWSIEGSLPSICVDRIQTQQVFINLISNAIEATDGSVNTAKILLRAFVTQEHEVIVQVIDNGTGLEDTEKIFDAFMTTKEKGMGIGLAVSRSIVEAHGGRLWAENNLDGGATFNVALPASSKREVR